MYRRVDDFLADWATETDLTTKLLERLTSASLDRKIAPGSRTLSDLVWHVAVSISEMSAQAGIQPMGPTDNSTTPNMAIGYLNNYQTAARHLGHRIMTDWSDDMLAGEIEFYNQRVTRGRALLLIILHQTHHRGQMTVLMRQSALRLPAIYGPTREDWQEMGVEPKW